jgi:hypothetical protein
MTKVLCKGKIKYRIINLLGKHHLQMMSSTQSKECINNWPLTTTERRINNFEK